MVGYSVLGRPLRVLFSYHNSLRLHFTTAIYLRCKVSLCERKKESDVTQSCLTLCDPLDCSPPGSSVHGRQ